MTKRLKRVPRFLSKTKERKFWGSHDSTDYVDWSQAKRATLPNLKPSTTSILLRLPDSLLRSKPPSLSAICLTIR